MICNRSQIIILHLGDLYDHMLLDTIELNDLVVFQYLHALQHVDDSRTKNECMCVCVFVGGLTHKSPENLWIACPHSF